MLSPTQRTDVEPISKQLTIVIGLTVVGFMAFGLALSFYRNVLFEKTLQDMELQNRKIAEEIARGEKDLEYFHSDQFKDKYAKENLRKLNPGEKILIIAQAQVGESVIGADSTQEQERREAAYFELLRQMPVLEHWKLYLFHHDKIEELRRGL